MQTQMQTLMLLHTNVDINAKYEQTFEVLPILSVLNASVNSNCQTNYCALRNKLLWLQD